MPAVESASEIASLIAQWEREYGSGTDPIPVLERMSEVVERETEEWYKQDPDPFDDRHPGRADPDCALGHVLKSIFKNENFMQRMVNSYLLSRDQKELHIVCCRLLLGVMPGLETTAVFQENEALVHRLIQWAQTADEPLSSYSIGLLSGAMEIQDIATNFKDSNATLVPLLMKRLHTLKDQDAKETLERQNSEKMFHRPFANIGKDGTVTKKKGESPAKVSDLQKPSKRARFAAEDKETHRGSKTEQPKKIPETKPQITADKDSSSPKKKKVPTATLR